MRQSWTDDRLDDLSGHMAERFDRVEGDMREVRDQLAGLQRSIIQVGGGLIAANLTLMAAVLGLIVTQL